MTTGSFLPPWHELVEQEKPLLVQAFKDEGITKDELLVLSPVLDRLAGQVVHSRLTPWLKNRDKELRDAAKSLRNIRRLYMDDILSNTTVLETLKQNISTLLKDEADESAAVEWLDYTLIDISDRLRQLEFLLPGSRKPKHPGVQELANATAESLAACGLKLVRDEGKLFDSVVRAIASRAKLEHPENLTDYLKNAIKKGKKN